MSTNNIKHFRSPLVTKGVTGFLLLVFAVKVILSLVFINTGFDLTDEGCYMLWYKYPNADPNPFYYFHKMVLGFWPFINVSIPSLRGLKFLSDGAVIYLVGMLLWRFTNRDWWLSLSIVALGFCTTIFSRIFYEGDMSYLLTTFSLVMPLMFYKAEENDNFSWGVLWSGVFIGLQFFNKFSASILTLVIVIGLIVYLYGKYVNYLKLLLGMAIGVTLFFVVTGYTPAAWYQEYQDGYKYVIEPLGYDPLGLILYYSVDVAVIAVLLILPTAIALWVKRTENELIEKYGAFAFMVAVVVLAIVGFIYLPKPYSDAHYGYQSMLLNYWYVPLLAGIVYLWTAGKSLPFTRAELSLSLVLFAIPLVSMAGTGTSLAVSLSAYLTPWFGLLAFLQLKKSVWRFEFYHGLLGALVLVGFLFFQIMEPFRALAPLTDRPDVVEALNKKPLRLDHRSASFLKEVQQALKDRDMTDGYPIVALNNLPGLVYLVGGYSPATPWYIDVSWLDDAEYVKKTEAFNCIHISRIKEFEKRKPIFMIHDMSMQRSLPCLLDNGFDLEKDYWPPVTVLDPYLQKDLQARNVEMSADLQIYIPRNAAQ